MSKTKELPRAVSLPGNHDVWRPNYGEVQKPRNNVPGGVVDVAETQEEKVERAVSQSLDCPFCGQRIEDTEQMREHIRTQHRSAVLDEEAAREEAGKSTVRKVQKG